MSWKFLSDVNFTCIFEPHNCIHRVGQTLFFFLKYVNSVVSMVGKWHLNDVVKGAVVRYSILSFCKTDSKFKIFQISKKKWKLFSKMELYIKMNRKKTYLGFWRNSRRWLTLCWKLSIQNVMSLAQMEMRLRVLKLDHFWKKRDFLSFSSPKRNFLVSLNHWHLDLIPPLTTYQGLKSCRS